MRICHAKLLAQPKQEEINDRQPDRDQKDEEQPLRKIVERKPQRAAVPEPARDKQQKDRPSDAR